MKWYDYLALTISMTLIILVWTREPDTAITKVDVTCDQICMIELPDGDIFVHEYMIQETLDALRIEYWEHNSIYLVYDIKTNKE
jgi:hypothetical protein